MNHPTLTLPADPAAALTLLVEASRSGPVLVFKKSPICPVSHSAEARYRAWLRDPSTPADLRVAEIDVIAQRQLARGLTAALAIQHESPQALLFRDGTCVWHESHDSLTREAFAGALGRAASRE